MSSNWVRMLIVSTNLHLSVSKITVELCFRRDIIVFFTMNYLTYNLSLHSMCVSLSLLLNKGKWKNQDCSCFLYGDRQTFCPSPNLGSYIVYSKGVLVRNTLVVFKVLFSSIFWSFLRTNNCFTALKQCISELAQFLPTAAHGLT